MFRALLVSPAIAGSPCAVAQEAGRTMALEVSAPFGSQGEQIRSQLADGKTYSEISPERQADVRLALDRIEAALGQSGSPGELRAQQRADLTNDEEAVNAILSAAREDSRLVCKREKPVGSNLPTIQCSTVAQRRKARQQSDSASQTREGTMRHLSN